MPIGKELKRLREKMGWSQAELARRAESTQAFITALETGRRNRLGADVLFRLADALGVEVEHFRRHLGIPKRTTPGQPP